MSNQAQLSVSLKRYEFLAILIPGLVVCSGLSVLVYMSTRPAIQKSSQDTAIAYVLDAIAKPDARLIVVLVLCLLAALILGHVVEAVAHFFIETNWFNHSTGFPSHHLMAYWPNWRYEIAGLDVLTQTDLLELEAKVHLFFHKAVLGGLSIALTVFPVALGLYGSSLYPGHLMNKLGILGSIFSIACLSGVGLLFVLSILGGFLFLVSSGKHSKRMALMEKPYAAFVLRLLVQLQEKFERISFKFSGITRVFDDATTDLVKNAFLATFKLNWPTWTEAISPQIGEAEKTDGQQPVKKTPTSFRPNPKAAHRLSEQYWFVYLFMLKKEPELIDKVNKYINMTAFSRNLAVSAYVATVISCVGYISTGHGRTLIALLCLVGGPVIFLLFTRFIYFYLFGTKLLLRMFAIHSLIPIDQSTHANAHHPHRSTVDLGG